MALPTVVACWTMPRNFVHSPRKNSASASYSGFFFTVDGRLEGWEDRINRPKHQLRQSKSPRRCQKIPQFDSCVEFFARTRFPNQRGNRFQQRCAQIYDDANAFLSSESFV